MKVAITSDNGKTICAHNGETPGFILYQINPDFSIKCTKIKLKKNQLLLNIDSSLELLSDHPLHGIDAIVSTNLQGNLKQILQQQNINVVLTKETDPLNALNAFLMSQQKVEHYVY